MEAIATLNTADRPGKTSAWTAFRSAGKYDAREPRPSVHVGVGTLDDVRTAFWQSYRHLFPPHALAAQTPSGGVVISWSILDEPDARTPYAAPVMLRFDDDLVDRMWNADPVQRIRLAGKHEDGLRVGLRGYDPYAKLPSARVIAIG